MLNTIEGGYRAKVYKSNNRKDDAVFSKDGWEMVGASLKGR